MLFQDIKDFIRQINTKAIPSDRIEILQPLVDFIQQKVNQQEEIRLHFICTHNSRRSHLAQIWAQTMAYLFEIEKVSCFSGGTATTSIPPMIIETLQSIGFQIHSLSEGGNPVYSIKYADNEHPIIGFSKK